MKISASILGGGGGSQTGQVLGVISMQFLVLF